LAQQTGKQVVSVETPQTLAAKRGATVTEELRIRIDPGFHVNSNQPKDEFLIPLKLTWTSGPFATKQVIYPKPEQVQVGSDQLSVFTGTFVVKSELAVSPQATAGLNMLMGKLHYQACDNQSCKRPATLDIKVPVSIQ
jgi:hypothetical protein